MTERVHPVLTAASTYRRQLLQREDAAVRRMVQAYGSAYQRMGAQIQALQESLDGRPMSFANATQLTRLRALRNQVELEVGRFGAMADTELTTLARESIVLGVNHSTGLVEATLTNPLARQQVMASFSSLAPAQIETMVGFLAPGSPLHASLTSQLGPAVAEQVGDRLISGIAQGFNPRKTAAIIRREMGQGLTWAVNTVRTANLWAYREATRANYAANPGVVSGWTWYATLDGRVCGNCLSQHGSKHAVTETLNGHFGCRCTMLPDLPLARSLGIDLPDIEPGEQWFARQPVAIQQDILGPGMLAAWLDGAVNFDQFRHEYEHPVYGTMQRMPSMKDLGLERYYTSGERAAAPARPVSSKTARLLNRTVENPEVPTLMAGDKSGDLSIPKQSI